MNDPGSFWDTIYDTDHYRYGTAPNAFLREQAPHIHPRGKVLCVGDGEGRNGVWLAEQGFEVTSIEPSSAGVRKIRQLADEREVTVNVLEGKVPDIMPEPGAYDAAVLTFIHLPPDLRPIIHRVVSDALAPGGLLILEAFTPAQLAYNSGGPRAEPMLFTPDLLRDDFAHLTIELLEEVINHLDEGPGHAGEAALVRLRARRT